MDASSIPLTPVNYPHEAVVRTCLKNGCPITIRPIHPDDAPRLQAGFQRLSSDSIYMRFLEPFRALADEQARRYATVDYRNQMALVAEVEEKGARNLVASARYSLVGPHDPGAAEAAIVVVDEYQRLGLAKLMIELLVGYACGAGVTTLLATVHLGNHKIQNFINRSGLSYQKKMLEPGIWEIRIPLV